MHNNESEVAQSCLTLRPMDCSLPGSSIHGIFQARILEWVAISFSRRSSRPRDWTQVSRIVGRRFTVWATREAHHTYYYLFITSNEEEKQVTEDEMVGWHYRLNGHEQTEQTLGDSEGQGSLAGCSSWGHKELDMTEWLNNIYFTWTLNKLTLKHSILLNKVALKSQIWWCYLYFKWLFATNAYLLKYMCSPRSTRSSCSQAGSLALALRNTAVGECWHLSQSSHL